MMRGYCGIGVLNMKTAINYGTLFRSASCLGASFVFLIGKRFKKQASDTMRTERHMPLYEYSSFAEFYESMPYDCLLVGVEQCLDATDLPEFNHPDRAIYLLGAEDNGIPETILDRCHFIASIPSARCLNVSVAGSIVLYDRLMKIGSDDS